MDNVYEPKARNPVIGNAWKSARCSSRFARTCKIVQPRFRHRSDPSKRAGVARIGVERQVFPRPCPMAREVDEFLKKFGYRFVLQELTHTAEVRPGGSLPREIPLGKQRRCAHLPPMAARVPSQVRRRSRGRNLEKRGKPYELVAGDPRAEDVFVVPAGVPAATYNLDGAIMSEDGKTAHVELAIAGNARTGGIPYRK